MSRSATLLGPERRGPRLRDAEAWWNDHDGQPAERVDELTGLTNRLAWDEAITRGDALRVERPLTTSVITIDVDGLPGANDTRALDSGDTILTTVAALVRDVIRAEDFVARIGDGEFGVLLPGADETVCSNVVARLRERIASATSLDGFSLSVAIGSATAPATETLTRAQRWADARMFVDRTTRSHMRPAVETGL